MTGRFARPAAGRHAASLRGVLLLAFLLFLIVWYASATGSASLETQVTTFLLTLVMVVGLQIFSGNSGLMSFAQMAFVGIGAYVSSMLTLPPELKTILHLQLPSIVMNAELPFVAATIIAALVAGVVAAVAAVPVLRLPATSAIIAIFSLLLISRVVFGAWTGVTRGSGGYYAVPHETTMWIALAWTVVALAIARFFRDGRIGLMLQASREDELAAASTGVQVRRLRARSWILGAMVSSVGGVLLAHQLTAFSPATFGLQPTFVLVAMLVVGGMLTVSGAAVGAALITLVQQGIRPLEDGSLTVGPISLDRLTGLSDVALVLLILGALYLRPEGLAGRRELDEHLAVLFRKLRRRNSPSA